MRIATAPSLLRRSVRTTTIWWRLGGLGGAGLLLEGLFLVLAKGATLRTWPDAIRTPTPIAGIYGQDVLGVVRYGMTVLALFAAYGLALWFSRLRPSRTVLAVVFFFPVLFAVPLWLMYPAGSQDMMHNTFDAVLLWQYGDNPLITPPMARADHPLFATLSVWEDQASYYGPLWYFVLAPTNWVGGNDFVANILAQKALIGLFYFGTTALVYVSVRRLRPDAAVPAVVFFAWNPLVLFETVGNGHNGILMVFFGMVCVWLALSRRWFWAIVALAVAVLFKYVFILLGPLLLLYVLHRDGRRALRPILLGGIAAGGLIILAFLPFYDGPDTFLRIYGESQEGFINSPAALMNTMLTSIYSDATAAGTMTKRVALMLFGGCYLWLLWRQGASAERWLGTSFYVLFLYLVLMSGWFWPWYVVWVVAIAALLVGSNAAILALVLSLTAMLGYIPKGWDNFLWAPVYPYYGIELPRAFIIWSAPLLFWATLPLQRLGYNAGESAVTDDGGS